MELGRCVIVSAFFGSVPELFLSVSGNCCLVLAILTGYSASRHIGIARAPTYCKFFCNRLVNLVIVLIVQCLELQVTGQGDMKEVLLLTTSFWYHIWAFSETGRFGISQNEAYIHVLFSPSFAYTASLHYLNVQQGIYSHWTRWWKTRLR